MTPSLNQIMVWVDRRITERLMQFKKGAGMGPSQGNLPNGLVGVADPTAQVGPTVIVGTAATAMRSDGAPKLADTAVTPDTYGDATHVVQLTVDQQGRITDAAEVEITGGGHTIQDEGTPLAQEPNLNFEGAGVEVTDDPGNNATKVTIRGASGFNAYIAHDDASPVTIYSVPSGQAVDRISIHVFETWDGAGADLSIKDGMGSDIFLSSEFDLTREAIFEKKISDSIASGITITITPGSGASQGQVRIQGLATASP